MYVCAPLFLQACRRNKVPAGAALRFRSILCDRQALVNYRKRKANGNSQITALGTGTVVLMIVAVAALFLVLTRHKYSAILLLVATAGGLVLNLILKLHFNRPRPTIFVPEVHAVSSSFPSGHAMSAAIVYGTVAYLAARLHRSGWARALVMLAAAIVILMICISRLYLGVHYPSDVAAGVVIGLAWAAFCMATLEAIQKLGARRDPKILESEEPAPAGGGPLAESERNP
jgi:undecaprenyl-diphosphatase